MKRFDTKKLPRKGATVTLLTATGPQEGIFVRIQRPRSGKNEGMAYVIARRVYRPKTGKVLGAEVAWHPLDVVRGHPRNYGKE